MNTKKLILRLSESKLFKDSSWALIGSVAGKGLSLVAGIVVARFLGKEIYGEYGMIKNTLLQIAAFSTLGLGYTGTRFISKYLSTDEQLIRMYIHIIYVITFFTSGLLAVLTFVFSEKIALYLNVPDTSLVFKFTAFIIIVNAINMAQIGILSGFKDFKAIAKNNTWGGVATFLTSVFFTFYFGLYGALAALLTSMIFNAVINCISICGKIKDLPESTVYMTNKLREVLKFTVPIALQESLYSVVAWCISVMIIKFSNYGELGLYQAAAQWSSIVLFIPGVMKNVMLSHFSSTHDPDYMRKKIIAINAGATFIPFLIVSFFSSFIQKFYGDSFLGLEDVLIVACFSSITSSVADVFLYELVSLGKTWMSFILRFFRDVLIMLITFVVLSNQYATLGAGLSVVLAQCFVGILFVVLLFFCASRLYDKKMAKMPHLDLI